MSYTLFNYSQGNQSAEGRWAHGPSMDGEGVFQFVEHPVPFGNKLKLNPAPPYIHNTPPSVITNTGIRNNIPPNIC